MTSPIQRALHWFWRGSALAEARRAFPVPSERETVLAQRARQSADVARVQLTPAEPPEGAVHAIACELYREAAYWALCCLAARSAPPLDLAYTEAIWDGLDAELVAKATRDAARTEALPAALRGGSFVYFAELPRAEQALLCAELQSLVELLLEKLNERSRVILVAYIHSGWRLALILPLLLGAVLSALVIARARELAHDKPWQASSAYVVGCKSPAQECAESPAFFFHTADEQNPWVEFDLGATKRVSAVEVDNREDCCSERAVPEAIEVSTDHKKWQTVGRKDDDFKTWRASFDTVDARWVRVHALKHTFLHLARVRIFR